MPSFCHPAFSTFFYTHIRAPFYFPKTMRTISRSRFAPNSRRADRFPPSLAIPALSTGTLHLLSPSWLIRYTTLQKWHTPAIATLVTTTRARGRHWFEGVPLGIYSMRYNLVYCLCSGLYYLVTCSCFFGRDFYFQIAVSLYPGSFVSPFATRYQ